MAPHECDQCCICFCACCILGGRLCRGIFRSEKFYPVLKKSDANCAGWINIIFPGSGTMYAACHDSANEDYIFKILLMGLL